MRSDTKSLEVKKSLSTGTATRINEFVQSAVFAGTSDGTPMVGCGIKIEGSVEGLNEWVTIATHDNTALTAGVRTDVPSGITRLRVTTTSYTSGTPVVIVSGKNSRTDQ